MSEKINCCFCFPAKCGIIAIGLLTMFLTVFFIFSTLIWFMNTYFHWWFTFITLLLYIPLALAAFFIFKFSAGDQEEARGGLKMACWFAIGSLFAVGLAFGLLFTSAASTNMTRFTQHQNHGRKTPIRLTPKSTMSGQPYSYTLS